MKNETSLRLISGLIAALLFYAAMSKLMDYDKSIGEMRNQIFPLTIANILTWLTPSIEILLTTTLLFPRTRTKALWGSLSLLTIFTLYIGIVMTGLFGRTPCSCGGILKNMSYGTHLIFNLFFLTLSFIAIRLTKHHHTINTNQSPKERRYKRLA